MEIIGQRSEEQREPPTRSARSRLLTLLGYLEANHRRLIDHRRWQQADPRISTAFVESTIKQLTGGRMCKAQQMRWSRAGAHGLLQVRDVLTAQRLYVAASPRSQQPLDRQH